MPVRTNSYVAYAVKLESTVNVDATPSPTVDAIQLAQPFEPVYDLAFRTDRKMLVSGHINASQPLRPSGPIASWTHDVHWRGVGAPTAGNPAELDAWFQAAGLSATYAVVGGVPQVVYVPASSGSGGAAFKSATAYYWEDGMLHKLVGAQTELSFSFDVGGPVAVQCASQGRYAGTTDVPFPGVVSYRAGDAPPTATDLTVCDVDGYTAGVIRKCMVKLGNQIGRRGGVKSPGGIAGFRIARRESTFEMTLEEPLIAEHDFRARELSAVLLTALNWAVPGATGTIAFASTTAVITKVTPSNDAGVKLLTIAGELTGATPCAITIT